MFVAKVLYRVVISSLLVSVVVSESYSCPGGAQSLNLSGKLGTSYFPNVESLGGIVSNNFSNTGISLDLSNNGITNISAQVFSDQVFRLVVSLNLSGNRLKWLDSGALDQFRCVTTLDLSDNALVELPSDLLETLSMLRNMDASHNEIARIGNNTFHKDLRALETVNLSYNRLVSFEPWPYIPELINQKLFDSFNLQHNQISRFTNTMGWIMKREYHHHVDLRYNNLTYFRIEQFSQYLEGKREPTVYDIGNFRFNVHNNPWYCDCRMYTAVVISRQSFYKQLANNFLICDGPSEFHGKKLGYFFDHPDQLICNVTDGCPAGCKCEDRPYDGYILVDCSRSGEYTSLPQTVPDGKLFLQMSGNKLNTLDDRNYLENIQMLDVSSNNMEHIENSIIEKAVQLQEIDIRNNSMEILPSKIQKFQLESVLFTGNPLVCSCDTLWINDWVRRHSQNMSSATLSSMKCHHKERSYLLVDVTWESLVCFLDIAIGVSVALGLFLLILIIATVVCWKHKYECKVLLYDYFRIHPFDNARCDKDDDATKMYDVYLSIDREDDGVRIWVKDMLLKRLEENVSSHLAYRVYYPCRQDDFGDSVADQMVENINKSRRVLAIVNASYVQNGWSIEEFDHAHRLMETANSGRLLVLVYGDLDPSVVTQEPLKTYLTQRQCFYLTDRWVWQKLRYELPHRPISNLTSASRESLTSGVSSIHATLSESSDLSMSQADDTDFVTVEVV